MAELERKSRSASSRTVSGDGSLGATAAGADPGQAQPEPKAQRNFTDPDARIMKDGATKEFVQAYNAQAVVDSHAQVIVVAAVTQDANDKKQLVPMLKEVKVQMGIPPQQATADNGYFSEQNVTDAQLQGIDLFVAPDRQKYGEKGPSTTGPPPPTPAWQNRCGTSCARQRDGRFINCARRCGTGFWTDQRGAGVSEIPAARAGESAGGMADDLRHTQSAETLPLRMEPPKRLKELAQPAKLVFPAARTVPMAQHPTR